MRIPGDNKELTGLPYFAEPLERNNDDDDSKY